MAGTVVTGCNGLVRGWRVGFWKQRINTSVFVWQLGQDVLVDTGPPFGSSEVFSLVKHEMLGNGGRRLDRSDPDDPRLKVIITHHHEDHSGNGGRLVDAFPGQLTVHAPVETAKILSNGKSAL